MCHVGFSSIDTFSTRLLTADAALCMTRLRSLSLYHFFLYWYLLQLETQFSQHCGPSGYKHRELCSPCTFPSLSQQLSRVLCVPYKKNDVLFGTHDPFLCSLSALPSFSVCVPCVWVRTYVIVCVVGRCAVLTLCCRFRVTDVASQVYCLLFMPRPAAAGSHGAHQDWGGIRGFLINHSALYL